MKNGDRVGLRQLRMQAPADCCKRHNRPVLISWLQCTNFAEYVRRFATFSAQHTIQYTWLSAADDGNCRVEETRSIQRPGPVTWT